MTHRLPRIGVLFSVRESARALRKALLHRGYLADLMKDAAALEAYCGKLAPAAVIVDLGHVGRGGAELVRRLRRSGFSAPIIATIDRGSDQLQVETLQFGADDFVQMPTDPAEVLERLDFILMRYGVAPPRPRPPTPLEAALTATERRILVALQGAAPQTMSRETLMWEIRRRRVAPDDRTLDVYISNIRRKIRMTGAEVTIETVRGVGFRCPEGGRVVE